MNIFRGKVRSSADYRVKQQQGLSHRACEQPVLNLQNVILAIFGLSKHMFDRTWWRRLQMSLGQSWMGGSILQLLQSFGFKRNIYVHQLRTHHFFKGIHQSQKGPTSPRAPLEVATDLQVRDGKMSGAQGMAQEKSWHFMSPKYGKEVENSTYRFLYIYTHIIYIYILYHTYLPGAHGGSHLRSTFCLLAQLCTIIFWAECQEMDLYTGANLQ